MHNKGVIYMILCLVFLHNSKMYAQDSLGLDLEAIWQSNSAAIKKIEKIDSICDKVDPVYSSLPFSYLDYALDLAKEQHLVRWIPKLELALGIAYRRIDNNHLAHKYLLSAIGGFEKSNNKELLANAYKEISYFYMYLPDYEQAMHYVHLAIDLYTELDIQNQLGVMHTRLGYLMQSTGRYDQVLSNLLIAEELLIGTKDYYNAGANYEQLAEYYLFIEDYDNAEKAFNASIESNLKNGFERTRDYIVYRQRANFYLSRGEYDKAEEDYKKVLIQGIQVNDTTLLGTLFSSLAILYASISEVDSAQHYLNKTEQLIGIDSVLKSIGHKGIFIPVDYELMYNQLTDAYALIGDHDIALEYMRKQRSVKDSMFNMTMSRSLVEMQAKYETEKKDVLLSQKERETYFLYALTVLIFLLLLLSIRSYNLKRKKNKLLEDSNEQKAILIKEIHHRVKNNLQILSSLLNLQSRYIKDPTALDVVIEGRNRVQSMSLIHQKLYMDNNLTAIDMSQYIYDMMTHLLDSFGLSKLIEVKTEVSAPNLDVDTAIPLGMILNELGTNTLKYAFQDKEEGVINIKLWITEGEELCLMVSDNGNGVLSDSNIEQSSSFGTDLIKILSSKLSGTVENESSKNGYSTLIKCKKYKIA